MSIQEVFSDKDIVIKVDSNDSVSTVKLKNKNGDFNITITRFNQGFAIIGREEMKAECLNNNVVISNVDNIILSKV